MRRKKDWLTETSFAVKSARQARIISTGEKVTTTALGYERTYEDGRPSAKFIQLSAGFASSRYREAAADDLEYAYTVIGIRLYEPEIVIEFVWASTRTEAEAKAEALHESNPISVQYVFDGHVVYSEM